MIFKLWVLMLKAYGIQNIHDLIEGKFIKFEVEAPGSLSFCRFFYLFRSDNQKFICKIGPYIHFLANSVITPSFLRLLIQEELFPLITFNTLRLVCKFFREFYIKLGVCILP